jgi:hypothetical protein
LSAGFSAPQKSRPLSVRGDQLGIAVQFGVSALIGLLAWRTLNDTPYNAEDIYTIFKRLSTQGVKRFLTTGLLNAQRLGA